MNPVIIKYQKIIDNLSLANKSITLAIILVLIFLVWYLGFWQNLSLSLTGASEKIETLKSSTSALKTRLQTLEEMAKAEAKAVSKESTKLPLSYQTKTVLYDLLKTTNNIVLLQLKYISPEEAKTYNIDLKVGEYGIIIKFQGDYFSNMRYLQMIEESLWKIFWDKLEYKVTQYPTAEVTLYVHTTNLLGG